MCVCITRFPFTSFCLLSIKTAINCVLWFCDWALFICKQVLHLHLKTPALSLLVRPSFFFNEISKVLHVWYLHTSHCLFEKRFVASRFWSLLRLLFPYCSHMVNVCPHLIYDGCIQCFIRRTSIPGRSLKRPGHPLTNQINSRLLV